MKGVAACRLRDAGETLARELRGRAPEEPFSVTVPFPRLPVEALVSRVPDGTAAAWLPPDGDRLFGWDEALATDGAAGAPAGASPIPQGAVIAHPGVAPSPPVWLGGAPFDPRRAADALWEGFERARFVLPRWLYRLPPDGPPTLTLFATAADSPAARERALEQQLPRLLALPDRIGGWSPGDRVVEAARLVRVAPDAFETLVERALDTIGRGALDKVVLARRAEIRGEAALDPGEILHRLGQEAPESTGFAFRFGGATFLGASPERLLLRRGRQLRTEAMAGTRAPGPEGDAAAAERELLRSDKDRREHAWVLRGIFEALEPVCSPLRAAPGPEVRRLRHVLHLVTPIEGEAPPETNLLELARRLHPTPAVGGYPSGGALAWLREHEPLCRGWFAGPVGRIDGGGDGELRVALRSGLIRDGVLHAFAGAGIVRGSVPRTELSEILAKLRPLLSAAGCET